MQRDSLSYRPAIPRAVYPPRATEHIAIYQFNAFQRDARFYVSAINARNVDCLRRLVNGGFLPVSISAYVMTSEAVESSTGYSVVKIEISNNISKIDRHGQDFKMLPKSSGIPQAFELKFVVS